MPRVEVGAAAAMSPDAASGVDRRDFGAARDAIAMKWLSSPPLSPFPRAARGRPYISKAT
ncbi:hypothetical protein D0U02_33355 [Burkholderia pseudomallei]|nr:hypothetical protein BURPS668_A1542 [Burkholderia pseudomallei 668]ARK47056.1 hypothetical protein BOC35_12780 [Burkholderia pseudomallei]EBA45230.1 hypothetical protein BURPS305_0920 [Burkholderia pseudomallei 305]ARK57085.1 hypothetical protein BOC36_29590 [Burkholderia pseudomallei]ARK60643.1 hypothetical protein BOC37_12455 [Burkholderia pseudomallei]